MKSPKPSVLSRQHKIQYNLPPVGRKRSKGVRGQNDPNVNPYKRISEYPSEKLTVSVGRLFCKACREVLSVKRSTLDYHVKSTKHVEGKKRLEQKEIKGSRHS